MDRYSVGSRVPTSEMAPSAIADMRAHTIAEGSATWEERVRFHAEFAITYVAAVRGRDTYLHWRAIQADSFAVAGHIEALAASRRKGF